MERYKIADEKMFLAMIILKKEIAKKLVISGLRRGKT